jgi:hypothetical protein
MAASVWEVDDRIATYPVTVDPWIQQDELTTADTTAYDFGTAVAVDGNTAAIGAQLLSGQGAVYIFTRTGAAWTQQAKLTASDGTVVDLFGGDLALQGDTLVVSATDRTVGSNADAGVVYVFTGSGANWTQQAELVPSDPASGARFGFPISLDQETIAVGCRSLAHPQLARFTFSPARTADGGFVGQGGLGTSVLLAV